MGRLHVCWIALATTVYACVDIETSITEQAATEMQGSQMQGSQMQGSQMQGMEMQGIRLDGATLSGSALQHVRVERGEVVAELGSTTLHGAGLIGAHFFAQLRN